MSVEGKAAIVTGGGGGLGRSHALLLAKHGAKVLVNDLGCDVNGHGTGDSAAQVAAEIRDAGGTAISNNASVADKAGAKSIVDDAVNEWGTVDILVNNAGFLRDKSFKKMTLEDWDDVIQVHLNGTAYVTWHAWPIMYDKNYGRIVFTTSTSGIYGNFGQSNYGAAKMGMLGMMNCLSKEGAGHNVHVNCMSPGAATRMTASVPGSTEDADNPAPGRGPDMVSPSVIHLCSEDAPNGRTVISMWSNHASCAVFQNAGVTLNQGESYEELAPRIDSVLDLSNAKLPGT